MARNFARDIRINTRYIRIPSWKNQGMMTDPLHPLHPLHHDVPLGRLALPHLIPLLTLFLFLEVQMGMMMMMTIPLHLVHHDVPLGRLAVPLLTLFLFLEVEVVLMGMMNSQKMMTILEMELTLLV